jgi:hypothetical protein
MERKEFIKKSLKTCAVCCGALAGIEQIQAQITDGKKSLGSDLSERMLNGSKSPDWRRAEKAISWIKNILDSIDEQLDEKTKIALLNSCGRSCYNFAMGVAEEKKITPEQAEAFLKNIERAGFKIERSPGTIKAYFGWAGEQSPQGISSKEGYCLCPIVEKDVPGLSNSFCNCSAGYVKEIFTRRTGYTSIKVEVLESIKRGGKDCRFLVEMTT